MENDGKRILRVVRQNDISAVVEGVFDACVARHQSLWAKVKDRRTIAVLLHLNTPAMVEDLNLLTMVRYFTFINLANVESDDAMLGRELANRLL